MSMKFYDTLLLRMSTKTFIRKNKSHNNWQKGFTLLQLLIFIIMVWFILNLIVGVYFKKRHSHDTKQVIVQPTATSQPEKRQNQTIGGIQLSQDQRSEEAATEEVNVPYGVKVKVKRSRTITRTIHIQWETLDGLGLSTGIKDIVNASIKGEIKQIKGEEYRENETVEYEVELNGEKSNRYKLTWIDTWRKGSVELQEESKTYFLPFEVREKTELNVSEIHSE